MKKITVIIPCYNVEQLVDTCLQSLESQTIGMDAMEVILVDDASTDGTLSHLMEFEQKYPESVMVIPLSQNIKQGGARNIALQYASGEYVVFLDSDDWIETDFYQNLYAGALAYDAEIVQYSITNVTVDAEGNVKSRQVDYTSKHFGYYEITSYEDRVWFLNHRVLNYGSQTKLYNRKFLMEQNPYFMEGVAYEEPSFVYPLLFAVNRVFVYDKPQYICRQHAKSTMHAYVRQKGKLYDHPKVQLHVFDTMMQKTDVYKKYRAEIDFYFLFTFFFETYHFAKGGGLYFGYDFFQIMQETLQNVPIDWKENVYLRQVQNKDVYDVLLRYESIETSEEFKEWIQMS